MARPGADDTITTELRAALRPSLDHVQAQAEASKASSEDLRRSARLLSYSARRLRQTSSQHLAAVAAIAAGAAADLPNEDDKTEDE